MLIAGTIARVRRDPIVDKKPIKAIAPEWDLSRNTVRNVNAGVKRKHFVGRIGGDLLAAAVADKKARSIRYCLSAAKLPMAKDLSDFDFKASPA